MKNHKWAIGFAACLTAFTVFIALDTFVLSSAYQTNARQINTEMIRQAKADTETDANPEADTKTDSNEQADPDSNEQADTDSNEKSDLDSNEKSDPDLNEQADTKTSATTNIDSKADTDEKKDPDEGTEADTDAKKEDSENSSPGSRKKRSVNGDNSDTDGDENSNTGNGSGSGKKKRSGEINSFRKPGSSPSVSGSAGNGRSGGIHSSGEDSTDSKTKKSRPGNGTSGKSSTSSFNEEESAREAAAVTTDNAGSTDTYQDENVTIQYTGYTTNGTTVHVADVQLNSMEYLKTAFAEDTYGKNVTESTSDIAAAHDAILAINGDYYGVQEKGYVIRNGILYRDKAGTSDVLCIYADGSMKIVDPSTVTAQELVEQGVWQAFSFGPGLIEDGEISVALDSEVGKAKASNPRTAIGMIDELHYVFVVSDGRNDESEGLSLYELATFMEKLGVKTAYNLDGGGSSTMVFQGEIINDPAGGFGDREREVSDIVYIG